MIQSLCKKMANKGMVKRKRRRIDFSNAKRTSNAFRQATKWSS